MVFSVSVAMVWGYILYYLVVVLITYASSVRLPLQGTRVDEVDMHALTEAQFVTFSSGKTYEKLWSREPPILKMLKK